VKWYKYGIPTVVFAKEKRKFYFFEKTKMQPTSNGHHKSNGKISPINEDTMKKLENNNHSNGTISEKMVEKKNFIQRLFKKDENDKEKEIVQKKKPEGPKLKNFEIVRIFIFSYFLICYHFLV
jgi:hypothetical protein